jgi:hypothetical protein
VCRRRDAIRLRLERPALHVGHHDQAVDEAPTVHGRDRHRHRHPFTVEVSQQLGLPRQIRAAALAEPSDGKLAVDAQLHTSFTPPVWSRSMRATSSPH